MKKLLLFGLVAFLLISLSSMTVADFTTDNQAWYTLDTNLTYGVLDQSPNGNDATNNGAKYDATENAFDFDGTNDYVNTNYTHTASDISASAWVKTTDTTDAVVITNYGGGGTAQHFIFQRHAGDYKVFLDDGSTSEDLTSSTDINTG